MVQSLRLWTTVLALIVVVVKVSAAVVAAVTARVVFWIDTYVIVVVGSGEIVTATTSIAYLHRTISVIVVHLSWLIVVNLFPSVKISICVPITNRIWIVCDWNDAVHPIRQLHRPTLSCAQRTSNRFFGAAMRPSEIRSVTAVRNAFGTWNRCRCRWPNHPPTKITIEMAAARACVAVIIHRAIVTAIGHLIGDILTCAVFPRRQAALLPIMMMREQQNKLGEFETLNNRKVQNDFVFTNTTGSARNSEYHLLFLLCTLFTSA